LRKNKKIILRADANEIIATGHVFRLLALAEMLKPHFEIWFCTQSNNQQLLETIRSQVDKLIQLPYQFEYCLPADKELDAEITFDLDEFVKENDIVVLDGYWFREKYQLAIKHKGAKLVMIDDFANQFFYADAVINHAPGVADKVYKGKPYTQYYLGLDYTLIRQSFFKQRNNDINRQSNHYFINFGGSDFYGLSVKYSLSLLQNPKNIVHLLTSKLFSAKLLQEINELRESYPNQVNTYNNLSADELIKILDTCTYAIVPSSTILFECVTRGLKCITGYYTQNQNMIYQGFVSENLVIGIGDMKLFDVEQIENTILAIDKLYKKQTPINSTQNIIHIFNNLC
jgi:UDP-2,4-diacetamido-2,4,6-trideoxy-beta-L-altropyranose hydrolase